MIQLICTFLLLLTSCGWRPSAEYREFYSHLNENYCHSTPMQETDFYVIFYVDAPHLDYTNNYTLIQTIAQHPNGSKNRDVGHAWIYLHGVIDGEPVYIEGGHSGELGIVQAKYFDGIMNYIDFGLANPTKEQTRNPTQYEPNPVKYLWEVQKDGFFQEGSGGHCPTFAVKVDITEKQFIEILYLLETYPFPEYSLIGNQCCSFIAQVCALLDLPIEYHMTILIEPNLKLGKDEVRLWSYPQYSLFTFGSPDILERSLMKLVRGN